MPDEPATPPMAGGAKGLWLKPDTYQALRRAALRKTIPDPQDFTVVEQNGNTHFRNRVRGKTGALIFNDCAGAEVARIEWENGLIITEGEQTVEGGCDAGSSDTGSDPPPE